MDIPQEFFRTQRLIFRPFDFDDADAFEAIVSDPITIRFVGDGKPLDRAEVELWITKSRQNVEAFGFGTGAIVEIATGDFIGWGGFARPEGEPEEIVYGFSQKVWGKGYGTEFVTGVVSYGFGDLNLPVLRATVALENGASSAILNKHGFVRLARTQEEDEDSYLFVLAKPNRIA